MSELSSLPDVPEPKEAKASRWTTMESLLADVQRDFDRLFGPILPSLVPFRRSASASGNWIPQVDIFEKAGSLVLKAELPGVAKSDVEVSMDDHNLIIKGERKAETEVKEEQYYRMERSYGSFYRSIPLPKNVKPEDVSAKFNDGVLTVTMTGTDPETPSATMVLVE